MTPKKLPSAGLLRGASLPPRFQKSDHSEAWQAMREVFAPNVEPLAILAPMTPQNGPMDLDLVELEAQAMQAAGIPSQQILGYDRIGFDTGHPIPGGGSAA